MLYHYTSQIQFDLIMKSGAISLSPSNLLEPVNPHWIEDENGIRVLVDETDAYKPVVWLTSMETPNLTAIGLSDSKTTVRISVEESEDYKYYPLWAKQNRIKTSWFKRLNGNTRYGTFYVCEHIIPSDKIIEARNMKTGELIDLNTYETALPRRLEKGGE